MSDILCLALVLSGFLIGWLLGAWVSGDFSKTYPADFIPSRRFREGKTKDPEG